MGASINDISKYFGFFDPRPPCPLLELICRIDFTQRPLLHPLFHDPPSPSDADIISGSSLFFPPRRGCVSVPGSAAVTTSPCSMLRPSAGAVQMQTRRKGLKMQKICGRHTWKLLALLAAALLLTSEVGAAVEGGLGNFLRGAIQ